jgi:hypothetical protein
MFIFARRPILRTCTTWGGRRKPGRLFTFAATVASSLFLLLSAAWIQSEHGGVEGQYTRTAVHRFQSCNGSFEAFRHDPVSGAFAEPDFFRSPAFRLGSYGSLSLRPPWEKLGFWLHFEAPSSFDVGFAYWLPTLLMLVVVALWLLRRRAWVLHVREGYCRECGYDLRGGHERCPECGVEVKETGISHVAFARKPFPPSID